MTLKNKNILIGITGGIAAYKINSLIRLLVKEGADVKVVLSPSAGTFVSAHTLGVLSRNTVYTDFFSSDHSWNHHVALALWADIMVIAPCTANTLGKIAHGLCDNFLMATYLSAKCPVIIVPAMDLDMYAHPTTRHNLDTIRGFGNKILPAEEGALASGLFGEGRMSEPETILEYIKTHFEELKPSVLRGKKILITAGPTYEAIDPVRFIGNHSSGKMGYAIAEEAARRGAQVQLISGPTMLQPQHENITLTKVTTAQEMYNEVFKHFDHMDIAIASAAVADYRPKEKATEKIKKKQDTMSIELIKNPDILRTMGERKKTQLLIGFALETENEESHAQEKLKKKNLDMIVLNSLRNEGAGFQSDDNQVTLIYPEQKEYYPLKSKNQVAKDILNAAETLILHSQKN